MGFRYQDYFDIQIADPTKRAEVIKVLNWLGTQTNGEMIAKMQQMKELQGKKVLIREGVENAVIVNTNILEVNLEAPQSSQYKDAKGEKHPSTLPRILAHEIFHLADKGHASFYTPERVQEIKDIRMKGWDIAINNMPIEHKKRSDQLTHAVLNPTLYSRSEAMFIAAEAQSVWLESDYLLEAAMEHYNQSDVHKLQKKLFEEPATAFENHIMKTYANEPERAGYGASYYINNYRSLLAEKIYDYVGSQPFPVNPEPAMDASCGISGDILQKINRGEMTLAQAGITLDADETLPDQHEGCLVVAPQTPAPESTKERKSR